MKITPEKIDYYTKNKEGKEYTTKFGKPYMQAKVKAGGKDIYLFVFNPEQKALLEVGKEVELDVTQNGQYTNYSFPKPKSDIEIRLERLESIVLGDQGHPEIGGHTEDKPESLPF
jgi:hypothetical protein